MSAFDSTKTRLADLMKEVGQGKIQLPEFQRGWVWDDEHIRSLLVSIARAFPVGAVMLLESGGDARFKVQPVEGIDPLKATPDKAEKLILDGQQRLTSLTQALTLVQPVQTRDDKKRDIKRYYYIDIEKALEGHERYDDAIFGVDEGRIVRENFGRDIKLDLRSPAKEYENFCFPCNQILNSDTWEEGLNSSHPEKFARYMQFRKTVLNEFRNYDVPVIELKKTSKREAVCLVFEKVNTGGVPLSVFELVTATYAADGFNLRDDWFGNARVKIEGRHKKLIGKPLLRDLEPTDFLQEVSLLHSYERRQADLATEKKHKEVTAVSAKREHILVLPLTAYQKWADGLTAGFFEADRFLRMEGFYHAKFLPYRTQLVPLATVMVHLGERWLEPVIRGKLTRWYWCGVLGELYGGAVETRIALDLQDVLAWVNEPEGKEPTTVMASGFQPTRLDTLRTRTSAAYRGIYVLLQRQGSKDFFWKVQMVDLDRDECKIDIHHIFPRDWCETQKIEPRVYNAIVNKTPISYKANRMIGGKAPSRYLDQLSEHAQVQISRYEQDEILKTHLIDPTFLRADDFQRFYDSRKLALIKLIEEVTGKTVLPSGVEPPPEDAVEDEEEAGA